MPTYAYTVNPSVDIPYFGPSGSFNVLDESDSQLLAYSNTVNNPLSVSSQGPVSGYTLAFSSVAPDPPKTTGQIWPRGAGQA